MKIQPLIFIDDDTDDLMVIKDMAAILYYPNPVISFTDPLVALTFLRETTEPPLFILSDLNMPKMNGFELRMKLLDLKDPTYMSIPFIILSTSKTEDDVAHAEKLNIAGFYKKAGSLEGISKTLQNIKVLLMVPEIN